MQLIHRESGAAASIRGARRGGALTYVVGGIALAAATVALAVDFDALKQGRIAKALDRSVAAFQAARVAEDTPALTAVLAEKTSADFDAAHMANLWAFDTTNVVRFEETVTNIDWKSATAKVECAAFVKVADGGDEVRHDVVWNWVHADGAWKVAPHSEPWGRSLGESLHAERRAHLEERVAQYGELRVVDDQAAIYALLCKADRDKVKLADHVAFFGRGILDVHSVVLKDVRVSTDGRTAEVDVDIDCELVPANLPPETRRNFTAAGTELRQIKPFTMIWHFEAGDWYFQQEEVEREMPPNAQLPAGGNAMPANAAGPQAPDSASKPH
jgi:hypothetical protein